MFYLFMFSKYEECALIGPGAWPAIRMNMAHVMNAKLQWSAFTSNLILGMTTPYETCFRMARFRTAHMCRNHSPST